MTWLSRLLPPSNHARRNMSDYHRRSKQRRRRMTLEGLEDRTVLSNVNVAFDPIGGILTITPDQFNNNFKIVENSAASGGTVTVESTLFDTTINTTSAPYTSPGAVTRIIVNFTGGRSDKDVVSLSGSGTVKDVQFNLSTTSLNLSVAGVKNAGSFTLSTASALTATVANSTFKSLAIAQTGAGASSVVATGNTVSGAVNISLGNAAGSKITVGASNLGSTSLTQGSGAGDNISVSGSTIRDLRATQGGSGTVSVSGVTLSQAGIGLDVKQGSGTVDVNNVTAPLPLFLDDLGTGPGISVQQTNGGTATVASSQVAGDIVVRQPAGNGNNATVSAATAWGNIKIDQPGDGYRNTAAITGSSAGFVIPAIPEYGIFTPQPFAGTASITQGNGWGNKASILNNASLNNAFITQGAGNVGLPQAWPLPPLPGVPLQAEISGNAVYKDVAIAQNTAANAEAGAAATILNSPSQVGNVSIRQGASAGAIARILNSGATEGTVGISQGDGDGDDASIDSSPSGYGVSIGQGGGASDLAAIVGSSVTGLGGASISQLGSGSATLSGFSIANGGASIAQGSGSATISGVTIAGGDASIAQGSGSATISGVTLTTGGASIEQVGGDGNVATIQGVSALRGNLLIIQGDGADRSAALLDSVAGSRVPFGPVSILIGGYSSIYQGAGSGTQTIDGLKTNFLALAQGDSDGSSVADITLDNSTIAKNLTITQGLAGSVGGFTTSIAGSGSVSVGNQTTINQYGGANQVWLGDVFGGSTTFVSYLLAIFTGDDGGGLVAARDVTVQGWSGVYVVNGGGLGNTFYDAGGNSGVTVSDTYNIVP